MAGREHLKPHGSPEIRLAYETHRSPSRLKVNVYRPKLLDTTLSRRDSGPLKNVSHRHGAAPRSSRAADEGQGCFTRVVFRDLSRQHELLRRRA